MTRFPRSMRVVDMEEPSLAAGAFKNCREAFQMRRKYFGLAIAAITVFGSMQAFAGDREIAEQIMTQLKGNRDSGALKDFTLDMKVDEGVVLFRGTVSEPDQKDLVLAAAKNVDGVSRVVDEVTVVAKAQPAIKTVKPKVKISEPQTDFSLREALAKEAASKAPVEIAPGEIHQTGAVELASPTSSDQALVDSVVGALGNAQRSGRLRRFGVDVRCQNGIVNLKGRASSQAQRDEIVAIASQVKGVRSVHDTISIPTAANGISAQPASSKMTPVNVHPVSTPIQGMPIQNAPVHGTPARLAAAPMGVQAMPAQYTMGAPSSAPVMGQPVPMGYSGAVGAPRYDAPNLPNYAWPGYASSPNYAALSYPQQYSPSAWPYIGPFYPYPQVPMGWRKVSLEWDDGWWFLDFTDR